MPVASPLLRSHSLLRELAPEPEAGLESGDRLPHWTQLAHLVSKSSEGDFPSRIAHLKKPLPTFLRAGMELFFKLFLRDPAFTKFLDCGWYEAIDLIGDQVVRNRALASLRLPAQELASYSPRKFFRRFQQQPCSRETVLRRASVCESLVEHHRPVLLLGDDDMVSIELARRGFSDITVVDIDGSLLENVRRAASGMSLSVKLHQYDFHEPMPRILRREYALVTFDPMYSIAGIALFLNAARQLTGARPGTHYLMGVHLMSLISDGVPRLEALLQRYGLRVGEYCQGFNTYPMPARARFLVQLVNICLLRSSTLSTRHFTFPFIFSDALHLQQA